MLQWNRQEWACIGWCIQSYNCDCMCSYLYSMWRYIRTCVSDSVHAWINHSPNGSSTLHCPAPADVLARTYIDMHNDSDECVLIYFFHHYYVHNNAHFLLHTCMHCAWIRSINHAVVGYYHYAHASSTAIYTLIQNFMKTQCIIIHTIHYNTLMHIITSTC